MTVSRPVHLKAVLPKNRANECVEGRGLSALPLSYSLMKSKLAGLEPATPLLSGDNRQTFGSLESFMVDEKKWPKGSFQ